MPVMNQDDNTQSSGEDSVALGEGSVASGKGSVAMSGAAFNQLMQAGGSAAVGAGARALASKDGPNYAFGPGAEVFEGKHELINKVEQLLSSIGDSSGVAAFTQLKEESAKPKASIDKVKDYLSIIKTVLSTAKTGKELMTGLYALYQIS